MYETFLTPLRHSCGPSWAMLHNGFHSVSMESIHIETDLELSEITQYFRISEVCQTLLHSSSCILIGCFARPKIVGLVDMECQNGMNFA